MVLFLIGNIRLADVEVIGAERERTVAVLPMEVADLGPFDS